MAIDRDITYVIRLRDETAKTLKGVRKNFQSLSKDFRNVGLGMTAVGTAGVLAITKLAKSASELEQLHISFETMLGDADAANKKIEELSEFAAKTPFTLPGVENAARQLLAVGFSAEELIPTLKAVGDVSAGLGRGEEGLRRLILNLGQVRTQGKLTGRELRDFAVLGVPLIDQLANSLGVAKEEIAGMVSSGQITDEIVTQAFMNMTREGGRFADLMSKQNKTLLGQFSNLQDEITLLMRTLGEPLQGPLLDVIAFVKQLTEQIGRFVQANPKVAEFAARVLLIGTAFLVIVGPILTFIAIMTAVISTIGAIGAAIGVLIAGLVSLVAAFTAHWEAIKTIVSNVITSLQAKFNNFVTSVSAKLTSLAAKARAIASKLTFGVVGGERRAVGGFITKGMALVGEQGPELVRLPRGSYVHPRRQTERMLRQKEGGSVNQNVTINMGGVVVQNEADEDRLVDKITRTLQLQNLKAA